MINLSQDALIGIGMLTVFFGALMIIALSRGKIRGFWNDQNGVELEELGGLCTIALFLFSGIKFSLAVDITDNQVEFFYILALAVFAVFAKTVIIKRGWPTIGIGRFTRSPVPEPEPERYQEPESYPERKEESEYRSPI